MALVVASVMGCGDGVLEKAAHGEAGTVPRSLVDFAVGISDSDAETFTHPAWDGLNVKRARVVVPYDVAQRPANDARRLKFEAWLQATAAKAVEPYVTLGPSDLRKAANGKYLAPTDVEFRAAFESFHATYPAITLVGAWNEPNFPNSVLQSGVPLDQPTCASEDLENCGPLRAAFYYRLVVSICPDCTVAAGSSTRRRTTRTGIAIASSCGATGPSCGASIRTMMPIAIRRAVRTAYRETRAAMQDRGIIAPEPWDGSPLGYDTAGRIRPSYAVLRDRDTNGP